MKLGAPKRKNKYNARRRFAFGEWFDSQAEYDYMCVLLLLKSAQKIIWFAHHPGRIELAPGITYEPDFIVMDPDLSVYYVEVKGIQQATWLIKKKLWLSNGPRPLKVVKQRKHLMFDLIGEVKPVCRPERIQLTL